jgi:muramidase (phage lysozyme)
VAIDAAQDIAPVSLQPQAAPVDTYVQPAREANPGGQLADLAKGLQSVSSDLGSYFAAEKERKDKEDGILGEAEFHKNNQQGYADAIRDGKIPPQSSQAFVKAYKTAQGTVAGQDLQTKFNLAYEQWGDKENADPAAYNKFVKDFVSQNIGATTDPEIMRGLLPKVRELTDAGQARHTQDVAKSMKTGFVNSGVAIADQGFKDARGTALAAGKPIDYDRQWDKMRAIRADLINHGMSGDDADKKLADLAADVAVSTRDPRALAWLDQKIPGTAGTFAQTPYGRDLKQKTIDSLDVINRRDQAETRAATKAQNDKEYDTASKKMIDSIIQDPNAPLQEDLLEAGAKTDGTFKSKALAWQKAFKEETGNSDPTAMQAAVTAIMNGSGPKVIYQGMENGSIRGGADTKTLFELADKYDKNKDSLEGVLKGDTVKTVIATIKNRTAGDLDLSKPFDPDGMTDQGLRLTQGYKQAIMEWLIANPKAGLLEKEKAAAEIGAQVVGRIQNEMGQAPTIKPGSPATPFDTLPKSGNTADGPAQPAQAAPQAPPATAPVRPQPKPAAPAQPPSQGQQGQVDEKEAKTWFSSLPAEKRAAAADVAASSGIPMADLIKNQYAKVKARAATTAPPQAGDTPAPKPAADLMDQARAIFKQASADDPNEDDPVDPNDEVRIRNAFTEILSSKGPRTGTGDFNLAVLKDDPHAARILDFISGPESNGNYNAYYAHGGSTKDLSKMTVGQVLAWQRQRVKEGSPSSATGRYQLMQKTLTGLTKRMGIDLDEKFTPLLQDRMAVELLNQRGYAQFKAGKMSPQTFGNNLAKEWASLPNLRTGRSQYAGDKAGNKSLVSPGQVLNVILDHPEVKKVAKAVAEGTAKLPE